MNPFDQIPASEPNPFDAMPVVKGNSFDSLPQEADTAAAVAVEPKQQPSVPFSEAVAAEKISSDNPWQDLLHASQSAPGPIHPEDRLQAARLNVAGKKHYVKSGEKAVDEAHNSWLKAIGQGMESGALRMARSLNHVSGNEPVVTTGKFMLGNKKVGYSPNEVFDPKKADDQLAGKIKKLDSESNYSLKDPRFWLKNISQLGVQIAAGAVTSPGTAAMLFQTSESLNTYDEVMQQTGDKTAATRAGLITGAINSLLDTVGLKGMHGTGEKLFRRLLNAAGKEGSTESGQSLVSAITKDYQILKSQGHSGKEILSQLKQNAPQYGKNAAVEGFVGSVLGAGANVVLGTSPKIQEDISPADAVANGSSGQTIGPVPEFIAEETPTPFVPQPDVEIDSLQDNTAEPTRKNILDRALDASLHKITNGLRNSSLGEFTGKIITPISSVLGKFDKRIPQRLRRMEFNQNNIIKKQHGVVDKVAAWVDRASTDDVRAFNNALLHDDISALPLIAGQNGIDLVEILKHNKAELDSVNRNSEPEIFFPLMSKNTKSFNKLLSAFSGNVIDPMRSNSSKAEVLSRAKKELIDNPTSNLSQFVEKNVLSPLESIRKQITDDVEGVQYARLIGDDPKDQSNSIQPIILELKATGKFTADDAAKINEVLKSFRTNKKSHGAGATAKNLTLIDTLGSPLNALSQLGDIGSSAYQNGVWNAVTETVKAMTGKSNLSQEDLGIASGKMDAELGNIEALGLKRWVNPRKLFSKESWNSTGKAVNSVFDLSGFTTMDAAGKRALINSTVRKLRKQSNKSARKLYDELRPLFRTDAEVKGVLKELRSASPEQYSDNTRFVLFSKLLDIQPIENSEVPQAYLEVGNGRLFYTLKTFALKRLDFIRQQSLNKITTGSMEEKITGTKNLAKLAVLLGGSEAGIDELKEFIKSGHFKDENFINVVTDNLQQMLFTSSYKLNSRDPVGDHLAGLLPVTKLPVSLVHDVTTQANDRKYEVSSHGSFEDKSPSPKLKSVKSIPLAGELYSNWAGYDKQRRSNKKTSLQSDYSEAKRAAKQQAEQTGNKSDLRIYRFLTKQNSSVSKITSRINKLKAYERRTGRHKTKDIEALIQQRDKRINAILNRLEDL